MSSDQSQEKDKNQLEQFRLEKTCISTASGVMTKPAQ
jgi:hypothetical protein